MEDASQSFELSAGFCFRLGDAGYYRGRLAVFRLAGKFEPNAVRVIKVDAEQSRELRDRPNIFDIPRSQPRLNFPKPAEPEPKRG